MNLLIPSFVSAIINSLAVFFEIRWLEYIFKPLTLILLILWFYIKLPQEKPVLAWLILAGLVFSLLGDIFLVLPGNWFLAGLIAFLIAHIAYVFGFNVGGVQVQLQSLLIALIILAVATPLYVQMRNGLRASGSDGLLLPVTIYVIIISIMVWSAGGSFFREDWQRQAALLITIGAGFFFLSDAILAWNRFVESIPHGSLFVIVTYHIAQYLITFGVLVRLELLPHGMFG
ncbi:MAG: lysoplasmalogenase [Anaerolineales bacterium]|nr:lysoplasmalogenase [Anaerolineales bacterium]